MGIHIVPGNSSWYLAKIWYLVLLRSKRKTEAISLRVEDEEEEKSSVRQLYLELGGPFRMPPPPPQILFSSQYVRMDVSLSLSFSPQICA